MTPESIAGLKIPEKQLQELIEALAEMAEPKFEFELPKAA
jgi:2'-5' RNA ligase